MIDETSGIIAQPIGQQYREQVARDDAISTTTWHTIVERYKESAVRDGARIDELRQSTEHWHDTAQMLKRQRDNAEEERDIWKIRAQKAVQERHALRVERDALRKAGLFDARIIDTILSFQGSIREPEGQVALTLATQRSEAAEAERDVWVNKFEDLSSMTGAERRLDRDRIYKLEAERDGLRKDAAELRRLVANDAYAYTFQTMGQYRTALIKALDAALAVRSTIGETP